VLDAIWLTTTNAPLYKPVLAPLLLDGVRPVPTVLFYLIYLLGVMVLAVAPAMEGDKWRTATVKGAQFGFFAYATYDLTNQATLKVWATHITVLDLCWGTFLTATAATAGFFASRIFARR
jgi:uncharacterized membrane protein